MIPTTGSFCRSIPAYASASTHRSLVLISASAHHSMPTYFALFTLERFALITFL
ncbi:MAG: hypothetical protein WCI00_00525 [bacterium]